MSNTDLVYISPSFLSKLAHRETEEQWLSDDAESLDSGIGRAESCVFRPAGTRLVWARLAGPKRGIFWLEHWDFIARICWNSMGFDGAYRTATVQATTRQPFFLLCLPSSKVPFQMKATTKILGNCHICLVFYLQFVKKRTPEETNSLLFNGGGQGKACKPNWMRTAPSISKKMSL